MSFFFPHIDFFFFRSSGWFLFLSSVIGFWKVKRWEQSVRTPAAPPSPEQVEEDHHLRQNIQRIFGISLVQPLEENQSMIHEEEDPTDPINPSTVPTQGSDRQERLVRDLQAAGFM